MVSKIGLPPAAVKSGWLYFWRISPWPLLGWHRSRLAVDLPRKLLFLAVGTHISPNVMFQTLADLGARHGMLLDGGSSSSMAIGTGASVVPPGPVYGWRPVATQFGV